MPELITGLTTSKVVSEVMPDDDKSDISDDNDSSDGSDDPTPAKVKCHRPDSMDSTDDQDLLFATIPGTILISLFIYSRVLTAGSIHYYLKIFIDMLPLYL